MGVTDEREAVVALARAAVGRTAPAELPLVDATARAYFAAPRRAREARTAEDMLGFGVEEAVALVTPAALTVAGQAWRFALDQAREAAGEEVGGALKSLLRRWLGKLRRRRGGDGTSGQALAPLTAGQLGAVRELAYARAQELGVDESRANLMADAIVGGLALRAGGS